ncbi:MAG: T9SS type A sorting domain-containing protein [Sporocytophaga sp.]|uniref:T9SS type A sorting domain-containing protein n=1 Tax=Sporocytophaga sp. TaxID=2231183 RepID=UPI001B06B908|nr:T9SS type A sorting domain-containing protein [Sporocytophaga sp.]MBO9700073.1 T9SS type A sorting domain-containing protein [Sporocytophaga sp.]
MVFSQQTDNNLSIAPNPFTEKATIHFYIDKTDTISLNVYNILGVKVKTIYESEVLQSGPYENIILGESLEEGVYVVKLEIGSKSIAAKFIKISSVTTGLLNTDSKNELLVFPNPTSDLLQLPLKGPKTVVLTDLNGGIVKSFKTNQTVISLNELKSGEYILTVMNDAGQIWASQKIVKI